MNGRFLRLSTADMINLAVESPGTAMNVAALVLLDGRALYHTDGRLRLAEICDMIEQRLADVPQLRRILYLPGPLAGRPLWIDDPQFRIERHVHQIQVSPPGDEPSLLRLTEQLVTPLLNRAHPLWRIWLVTGLPDGQLAAVIVLHHVVADGLAAIRLLTTLLDAPGAATTPTTPGSPPEPVRVTGAPRWADLVADNAKAKLAGLLRTVRAVRPQRLAGSAYAGLRVLARTWHAPRTSLNAPIGPQRRLAVLRLNLATAKRVAHRHGGTANDLVLNLAAGGLRALLQSRGESVDRLWLHTTVAVSLRPAGAPVDAGNRAGAMVVRLPLSEPDPAIRLRLVGEHTARTKRDRLYSAGNGLLAALARVGLARWFSRRQHLTNLVESNVAGPSGPVCVLGAPVLDLIPVGTLAGNLAISFLALSYDGQLTITVQADADRFPDLPILMAAMQRDWTTLTHYDLAVPRQTIPRTLVHTGG